MKKVCLISGGSSGIGLATAKRFLKDQYRVGICGRNPDKLQAALDEFDESFQHENIFKLPIDLSQKGASATFVDQSLKHFQRVDVLVNNAGIAPLSPMAQTSDNDFDQVMKINIRAVFESCQAVWDTMAGQKSGAIVNISSLAAVDPFDGFSVYGASKAWVDLFSKAIAKEGKPNNISVFSIRPGAVETPLLKELFPDFPTSETISSSQVAELIWKLTDPTMKGLSGQAIEIKS